MAEVRRHLRAIAVALLALGALAFAPAMAEDQGPKTNLYDRPVLAIDPGMHTATIWGQAIDDQGRFAVTGGADRTVRIWSVAERRLLRTIWVPVGPEPVGEIRSVAISPDGTTVAAGGWTERLQDGSVIYLFDRESGELRKRIPNLPSVLDFLTFSPDGRYLAATLISDGIRVFDRDRSWDETYRDQAYEGRSHGATFASDGRLATTSYDGKVRLYRYDPNAADPRFYRVGEPVRAPSGRPFRIAFRPDGKQLAVGYRDVAVVDILDGTTLAFMGEQRPADLKPYPLGLVAVAWSRDGQTLFAAGSSVDAGNKYWLFAWDRGGLGGERRMTYCAQDTATDVNVLPDNRLLVAALTSSCFGLVDPNGGPTWTLVSPILVFDDPNMLRVSDDGKVVDFGEPGSARALRFDLRSLNLSSPAPKDDATHPPNREGLAIERWQDDLPTLAGEVLPLRSNDLGRSLAIAPDSKRFFIGSAQALTAFDSEGAERWRRPSRGEVVAVNASRDGRIVVAAYGDGTIRWRRADDGRELLALQVLQNGIEPVNWDWVLWTPEGFYEATPGAENVLKWVVNHGPDSAASVLPVSAIARLHRPNALPYVLDELETAHALGVDEITAARLDVQKATGSAKPPGGVLHVLAVGVDNFGNKAGGLHLDYAAEDARDVAMALMNSQNGGPGKASLYADVKLATLTNDKADGAAILDALDAMADSAAKDEQGQDAAVILVSSHGEMIDGQFYLIPHGFDAGSKGRSVTTAVSASQFGERIGKIAAHAKVLLLLDACYSGAVGAQAWAKDPDSKVLQDALDIDNVTVLTSSKRTEKSEELPEWKHGAFAQAFLDALVGAADSKGIITVSTLEDAMENEVGKLTQNRQHVGTHRNFSGDLFVAGHY